MDSDAFKDFEKWAQRPDKKAKEARAQTNAWGAFIKQFQNANENQFVAQINIDENCNIRAEMFFKAGKGSLQSVFGSHRHYWRQKNENCCWLGRHDRLSLSIIAHKSPKRSGNTRCKFCRNTCKPEKNIQTKHKQLRDTRCLLCDKIQRNFSTNQAKTHNGG